MTGEMNQQRFKALLKETITLLCSNGLNYKSEFSIEAVIGITIDQESILLVSIQDTITNNDKSISAPHSMSTHESISTPQLLQADCVKNRFTASPSRTLKPFTDTNSPRNDKNDKHFGDIAIEIVPVLHQSEDFESTHFAKCADGLNIKLEQTEDSFELKLDNRSSSSCESIRAKPTFASDDISLSCAEVKSLDRLQKACFSNGERHAFSETHTVEKQEEFPGVVSDSRTILETSTLNNNLSINRAMQSYPTEETLGGRTSVGHPDSEIATASIRANTVALPRVHSVRKSYVLPNNLQDMQPATGRNRKKSTLSPYQCKICGKRIGTLHSLTVHEATVHLGKYRYSCPNCGKGYTVLSNLRAHIACKHNKQKEFVCGFCGREYGYKHSLKEHILLVHNGNSGFN